MDLQRYVTYFEEPGPHNTETTLELAQKRADELEVGHVVVASDTGKTAQAVLGRFHPGRQVVVVTNPAGMRLPIGHLHDYLPRFREYREGLQAQGRQHVQASLDQADTQALRDAGATVHRIDWRALASYTRSGLVDIDRIGVATRVALTISVWAFLAKAVPADVELIALAGCGFGGGGADTALVIRSAERWGDWRVLETIARPRVSPPSEA